MLHVSTSSFLAGIAGDRLLGPSFLPPPPSEAVYHDFLRNVLPELLQYMHMQNRIHLWIMHDGAPPYFLVALREFLNNLFPERIGHSGLTAWPTLTPDLSHIYFYLWYNIWTLPFMPKQSVSSRTSDKQAQSTGDDSYDTWNFPASQAITVQKCNILRWSWTGTMSIFFHFQEAINRKRRFRRSTFI